MTKIGDWLDETYLKFAEQENKDPCHSANDFLQRYVFVMFMKFSLYPHRVAPVVIQVNREKDELPRRSFS